MGSDSRLTDDDLTRTTQREWWAASSASLGIIGLFVVNAYVHGALGASRNDDWAYLRVAFRLARTGDFALDGWTQMTFVGQAALAWPIVTMFGPSIVSMQLLVAVLAWIGLLACYWTLRTFAQPLVAGVAVGVLAVGPVFGSLATSFMTDVPSFSFQMLTLFSASRLIQNGWSRPWFAATCALGFAATSIREYGLVVVVVCLVGAWSYCRPVGRERTFALAVASPTAALVVALLAWRSQIPNGDPNGVPLLWTFEPSHAVSGLRTASRAALTLSLLAFPFVAFALSPRMITRVRHSPSRATVLVAAWVATGLLSRVQFVGNYVGPNGSYDGLVLGVTPPLLGSNLFLALRWAAYLGLLALLLLAGLPPVRRGQEWRNRLDFESFRALDRANAVRGLSISVAMALACTHLALLLTSNAPFFDRYLIVLVPLVAAHVATALTVPLSRFRTGTLGILFVGLLSIGALFVDATAALDGAKWRFAAQLADRGFAEATIDGGFEWFNFHQSGVALQQQGADRNWWTSFYASSPVCVTVVVGDNDVPDEAAVPPLSAHTLFGHRYRLGSVIGPSDC